MKRSSPVNLKLLSTRDPALMASAARYSPAGQPSVRSIELVRRVLGEHDAGAREQRPCLRSASSRGRRRRSRRCRPGPAGAARAPAPPRRDPIASCEPGGQTQRQLGDDVATPTVGEGLGMVEDDGHRGVHRGDRRDQRRDARPGRHRATPRTETPSARSARRDRRPRRGRSGARSGRCRGRPPTATPPAVACARPTAPTTSSCRSPPARRRRAPRAGVRRRDARRGRCGRRCPGGPGEARAWIRRARTTAEVAPGAPAVTRGRTRQAPESSPDATRTPATCSVGTCLRPSR